MFRIALSLEELFPSCSNFFEFHILIDFLDGRARAWVSTWWCTSHVGHTTTHVRHAATWHSSGHTTGSSCHFLENRHCNSFEGLLFLFVLLFLRCWVGVEPLDCFLDGRFQGNLIVGGDLVLHLVRAN